MVFVYTGVFSEYNIINHYNSVKKHRYWLFADGDSPMFQLASMLPMFDVYIGRTLLFSSSKRTLGDKWCIAGL